MSIQKSNYPLDRRTRTVVALICIIAATAGGAIYLRTEPQSNLKKQQERQPSAPPKTPAYQFTLADNRSIDASDEVTSTSLKRYRRRFVQPSIGNENIEKEFRHLRRYESLVMVSPTQLVSADANAFAWLNLETGKTQRRDVVPRRNYIRRIIASRDRKLIIGGQSGAPIVQLDVASNEVTTVPVDTASAEAQGMLPTGTPQAISADSKRLLFLNDNQPDRKRAYPRLVIGDLETGAVRKLEIDIEPSEIKKPRLSRLPLAVDVTHASFLPGDDLVTATGWWQGLADHSFIVCLKADSGEIVDRREVPRAFDKPFSAAKDVPVFATSDNQGISVWTWNGSEIQSTLELHAPGLLNCSIALSNDATQLAAIDSTGLVSLWDLQTERRLILGTHGAQGLQAIFSSDQSQIISSALDGRIRVWRTKNIVEAQLDGRSPAQKIASQNLAPSAQHVAISPDGRHFAITDGSDRVQIWNAKSGKGFLDQSIAGAGAMDFSSSKSHLVVSGKDRMLTLIDLQTPGSVKRVSIAAPDPARISKRFQQYLPENNVSTRKNRLQLSRDGNVAGYVGTGYLQLFNLEKPDQAYTYSNISWNGNRSLLRSQSFTAIAVNGDGALVAGAALDRLKIWRARTGELIQNIKIRNGMGKPSSLCFAADGSQLACLADGKVTVYDVRNGEAVRVIEKATAATLFDNAEGKLLHGNLLGEVILTDLTSEDAEVLFAIDEPVESIEVDRNGCIVVKGGSATTHLFEPLPDEIKRQSQWPRLSNIEFAPVSPGKIVPNNQTFTQWRERFQTNIIGFEVNPETRQRTSLPPNIQQVRYSSNGRRLKAFLHQPKGPDKPLPGLVFLHGGFTLSADDMKSVLAITKDRFVVMAPAMRGENGNPGTLELMCGEVDDARAAIQWLATQSFVDSKHIYAFGHSVGGATSALLSLRSNVPIVHSGSCGGIYTERIFDEWADMVPFDNTAAERKARLLVGNLPHMQRHHFAFLGKSDPLRQELKLPASDSKLSVEIVPGDHFTSFEESLQGYLKVIDKPIQHR